MNGDACADERLGRLAGRRRAAWPPPHAPVLLGSGTARRLWSLAWPAILHAALVTLVFTTDRLLLGRLGAEPLASLHLSTTLSWAAHSVLSSSAIGAAALVGRQVGAGRPGAAARTLRAALMMALLSGAAAAAALWCCGPWLLTALFPAATTTLRAQAWAYLSVATAGLPAGLSAATAAACLQAAGDTKTPLWATLGAALLNVVLSAALVFGLGGLPALGVRGAAVGTACAFTLEAALLLSALDRRSGALRLCWQAAPHDGAGAAPLRRLVRVSLPTAVERLLQHSGHLAFVMVIATLGSGAMAAHQAIVSVESHSWLCADGFGIAAAALVAQRLGAGRPRQAVEAHAVGARLALLAAVAAGLVMLLAPAVLLAAFSLDASARASGTAALFLAAAAQPAVALAVVGSAVLRGAGDTRTPLAITLVCGLLLRLLACWVLVAELGLGLSGAWLASGIDWAVAAILVGRAIARRRWLDRQP